MKNTLKFAALQGMLGVMLAFLAPLLFSIPGLSRRGSYLPPC